MNSIDQIIIIYLAFFSIHFIVYLLYQSDKIKIREKSMCAWIRFVDIVETFFLVATHITTFSTYGSYGLGIYYILSIILLLLQIVFGDMGFGQMLLDIFWIGFYILMFSVDVCKIGLAEIVTFVTSSENIKVINYIFNETSIGKLIIGVATPILKTLILEAIHHNE